MKKTSYILLAFAAMLGLGSCSSDVDTVEPQRSGNAVVVNAQVGAGSIFTRTSPIGTDDEQTQFNADDQIALSDGTKTVNYTLGADGKTWSATTAGEALLWLTNKQEMTFQAYYPITRRGNSFEQGSVATSQGTLRELRASDYMTATKTASEPDNHTLNLEFERRTARVVVNIVGYNDQFDEVTDKNVVSVEVFGSRNSSTTEPYTDGIYAYNMPTADKPNGGGKQFVALVFPTDAKANSRFLRLTVGEIGRQDMLVTGIPQLEAGKSYSYDLTIGKNTVKVESVSVSDWTDGDPIDTGTGQAEEGNGSYN